MQFFSVEFFLFLLALVTLLRLCRRPLLHKAILLLASYYFYAHWDLRFVALLLACTLVNYWLAARMVVAQSKRTRRGILAVAVFFSIGVLAFFKYANFFLDSMNAMLGPDTARLARLDILLPLGISFFTFRGLTYIVDLYRGKMQRCRSPLDYAVFVSFFPHLAAGPIARASEFIPQLERPEPPSWYGIFIGIRLFVLGLFKKVFIADNVAFYVDYVFENAGVFSGATLWLATIGFAVQIYCDFSGYSDMAIGVSRLLGFDCRPNFNMPYAAKTVREFWQRWHISLSTWLRDYVYIPLGGNRNGRTRTVVNLMVTMVVGGLWHGAAWTFVLWGTLHGTALCMHHLVVSGRHVNRDGFAASTLTAIAGWAVTMLVVLVGWVLFRAEDSGQAALILSRMFTLSNGVAWNDPFVLSSIGLVASSHLGHVLGCPGILDLKPNRVLTPAILCTMIWLVLTFCPREFQPFIYAGF